MAEQLLISLPGRHTLSRVETQCTANLHNYSILQICLNSLSKSLNTTTKHAKVNSQDYDKTRLHLVSMEHCWFQPDEYHLHNDNRASRGKATCTPLAEMAALRLRCHLHGAFLVLSTQAITQPSVFCQQDRRYD